MSTEDKASYSNIITNPVFPRRLVFVEKPGIRYRRCIVALVKGGTAYIGFSECSPEDMWDKSLGVKIAEKRAYRSLYPLPGVVTNTLTVSIPSMDSTSDLSKYVKSTLVNSGVLRQEEDGREHEHDVEAINIALRKARKFLFKGYDTLETVRISHAVSNSSNIKIDKVLLCITDIFNALDTAEG